MRRGIIGSLIALSGGLFFASSALASSLIVRDSHGVAARLIHVDPETGKRTFASTNADTRQPQMIWNPVAAANGDALLVGLIEHSLAVIRVDTATGTRTVVSSDESPPGSPEFGDGCSMLLGSDQSDQVFTVSPCFGVIQVDPSTGMRKLVSTNADPPGAPFVVYPVGVAVMADGDLAVLDFEPYTAPPVVIRIDSATGQREVISANDDPAGAPQMVAPTGIATSPEGDLYVADDGSQAAVIGIDPDTGARSTITDNTELAQGPPLDIPGGIAVDANGETYVTELADGAEGVIQVDPATGLRSRLSTNTGPPGKPQFIEPLEVSVGAFPTPLSPKRRCAGRLATVVGTEGADRLRGTSHRDVIWGGRGADTLRGLGGGDVICGGEGGDNVISGRGADRAFGGGGADLVRGGRGADLLRGGNPGPIGRGRLDRPTFPDRVIGGPGRDVLIGGRGDTCVKPPDRLIGC